MITVTATIVAKSEYNNELLEGLKVLVAASRKEVGCHEYRLVHAKDNPLSYLMVERWESLAHLEQHRTEPHYKTFGQLAGTCLAQPVNVLVFEEVI